jgi:hypothetical protein
MPKKGLTLNDWMLKNRWNNTAMAHAITVQGHSVGHSQISQIRHKKAVPSGRLARVIYEFVKKEVSLDEILSCK